MAQDYTPEEVDQFVSEFIGRAREHKQGRKVWEQAMDAQRLAATANNPGALTETYAADPTKAPERVIADAAVSMFGSLIPGINLDEEKLGQLGAQAVASRRSEFTAAAEAAWQGNREEIGMEWYLQFTPADIRLFGGGSEEAKDLAQHLETIQEVAAIELAFQQQVDIKTDERWKARENRGIMGWARDTAANLVGRGMTGRSGDSQNEEQEYNRLRRQVEGELRDPSTAYEDRISTYMSDYRERYIRERTEPSVRMEGRKVVRTEAEGIDGRQFSAAMEAEEARIRQLLAAQGDAGDILGDKSLIARGVDGVVGVIPWTVDKVDQGLEGALWGIEALTPGHGTYDQMRANHEYEQAQIRSDLATMSGEPNEEFINQVAYMPLKDAFNLMEVQNKEEFDTYMMMAGFDPTMAFALFSADVLEDPGAKEQMVDYVEELKDQERQAIEDFEAADFRVSGVFLDMMASYGRNIPGRLSTYASLLFTDGDYFDDAIHGRWGEFFTEIEKESEYFGHTPSAALGIDGSLSGLLLDLGSGIAFDPFTWIFGPRASVRSAKAGSMAEAARIAEHPIVRQFVKDSASIARSPSRGIADLLHSAGWADSRFVAELLDIVGFKTKQLPASPWRATRGAEHAMEVETRFLTDLIDDEMRLASSGVDPVSLAAAESRGLGLDDVLELAPNDLGDNILANGFEEYITVSVSRGDGFVYVDDGVKRIVAAERSGISHIPVRLKLVDDFAVRPSNLSGAKAAKGVTDSLVRKGQTHLKNMARKQAKEKLTEDPSIVSRHALSDGSQLVIRNAGSPKNPSYMAYVNNAAKGTSKAVGGFYKDEIGILRKFSGSVDEAITLADDGRTVAQAVIDAAEKGGATPLQRLANSQSISDVGYSFLKKEAARLGQTLDFPMRAKGGKALTDLLGDKATRRSLKGAGAGDVVTRPDQFFPREMLLGQLDEAAMEAATLRAIMRGAVPDGVHRSAISRSWNGAIRKAARDNASKGTQWVERYLSQQNTVRRLELAGSRAMDRIIDTTFRVWGDDVIKVDHWQTRFMEYQRRAMTAQRTAMEQLKLLTPMRHQLDAMLDKLGASPYASLKGLKGPKGVEARAARKAAQKEYDDLLRKFEAEYAAIDKELAKHADTKVLSDLVEEMYDDYNRTYIATNPAWAGKVDPTTGMVPWDDLKKGSLFNKAAAEVEGVRNFIPEDMKALANELGVDAEQLVKRLSNTLDSVQALNVPLSPLELTLAREMGGAAYTRITQRISAAAVRDAAHGMNNLWKVDKVFRPATAITVSMDELQRIWHIGGMKAFMRWQGDRALFMRARAQTLLSAKNPLSRKAVRQGVTKMSARAQQRVQALSDYPTHLKAAERQLHDGNGLGYADIRPGEGQYLEAAQRWTGGLLQDSGFRAYLRGREAFKEWFFSPDGARMRNGIAMAKNADGSVGTRLLKGADEAFDGWTQLFEEVILSTAKKNNAYDDVMKHFRETAAKIDNAGGRPHELPSMVFDNLGPVRGVKKNLGVRHPVAGMTETFFDSFFMDPVNYRRGFLAEQVRAAETARLTRLFTSQNKTIVTDMELERLLGLKGMGGGTRSGLKDAIYDTVWDTTDYVPQGHIDDLVEAAVEREIDNVLYTWDRGSRLGAQSQAVFPFGKPWADMAGFWGKEMMRKPVLRGVINETNFLGLRTAYNKIPMPFNPKPAAMMSRLAHTDFTIDKGLHPALPGQFGEGGILPGADETDFSPMLFLPTGGDNPFGAMLPGIGYVPMWGLDLFLQNKYDPIDNPQEYQDLVDTIADFVPAVGYSAGTGIIPRVLGGGTIGNMTSLMIDGATFINHEPYFFATNMLGDISRELDRTRELSAILADPDILMDLEGANQADVETLLLSIAHDADNNVAGAHAAETVARFIFPASNQYETAVHEIHDVWVDAAQTFPELAVRPSLQNADLEDPEIRRQYANDVRGAFYDLPTWQRDLFVAQQPSLAVNLVGSWDWTANAKQANIEGSDTVYRSGGTAEDLALHQAYVDANYIRPIVPIERAKRIIGMMQASKERAAKHIYESQAGAVNDAVWDQAVSDDTMRILNAVLDSDFADEWALTDARDLWDNWSSMESRIEEFMAERRGIEPVKGNEDFEKIREMVFIPSKEKPWGRSWPGLDDEEISQRFRDVSFRGFTDETIAIADGLGIPLTPGMTGMQLFSEVQAVITEVDSPLYSTVRPAYDHYIGDKGVGARAADSELAKAKNNPDLDEDWRSRLNNWMVRADRHADQWRDEVGGVPLATSREMAQEFAILQMSSGHDIAWDDVWKYKYERSFGPLEWEAPQPLSPLEDGLKRPGTVVPYIKNVVDGDSIVFQERRGAQELRTVRLIGVNARDYGLDDVGAAEDKNRLQDALQEAVQNDVSIYLVRDPLFGDTDHYGRMLAWLWIGDEPFYFEDEVRSTQTPSGGES